MRGFVKSNAFKILLMVVVVTLSILILSSTVGSSSVASLFGIAVDPMTQVVSSLSDDELEKYKNMSIKEIALYIKQLEEENAKLSENLVDYYDIKVQNEEYKKALEILDKNDDLQLLPSKVTAKAPSDPFASFTIDVGSDSGVSVNDPVITNQGLIGVISEVHKLYSKVKTIYSEDISIAACSKQYSENGVVMGDAKGSINNLVKLKYLTVDTKLKEGTLITTSGASETYPENLIIGKVVSVVSNPEDVSMYALVEVSADIKNISSVYIITDFSTKNQIENNEVNDQEQKTAEE